LVVWDLLLIRIGVKAKVKGRGRGRVVRRVRVGIHRLVVVEGRGIRIGDLRLDDGPEQRMRIGIRIGVLAKH
jgi:hypothetical protein